MRRSIKLFASIVAESLPVQDPIYEFGSLLVPGQKGLADLRPIFEGRVYVGADMREGPGVDKVLDLQNVDLDSESVGTVLCFDTLEHVEHPHRALQEIHRVLSPSGLVVISSVMNFPIHDYPFDYWRFTPEAFKSILKPFDGVFEGFAGMKSFPHTIVGVGFKGEMPDISVFTKRVNEWQVAQKFYWEGLVREAIPPVMLPFASQLYTILVGLTKVISRLPKGRG